MSEDKPDYTVAQVTGCDTAAEYYARLRDELPPVTTAQAYREALLAFEAFALRVEAYEAVLFKE